MADRRTDASHVGIHGSASIRRLPCSVLSTRIRAARMVHLTTSHGEVITEAAETASRRQVEAVEGAITTSQPPIRIPGDAASA